MADYTIAAADPRWKRFEKLGARMLATLSPNAHVVYNDSIRGKLSQTDRQIDVSIRSQRDGAEHLAIVQCRDYKEALDVNAVGEFDSVNNRALDSAGLARKPSPVYCIDRAHS
jgi:Restriction endonuclease